MSKTRENPRYDWMGLAAIILTILLAVGGATWVLRGEFGGIHRRLDKFDSAIRILSNSQTDDIKGLINEILAQAREQASLGNPTLATRFVATAAKLTREEAQLRAPANPEFFETAAKQLNQFRFSTHALDQQIRAIRLELAEYRSAITPLGENIPPRLLPGEIRESLGTFRNGTISGGNLVLDARITWVNVIFENVNIVYKGGPLRLRNVRFVNCTFEVPSSPMGDQLLNIAILADSSAVIG